jgi:GPH family glycoside/pentoside/hexuronide:cation symporter
MILHSDRERIGWIERIGYAGGDLGFCLYWNTFSVFLMIFYTDTFGISAAAAGTMLAVTRMWDNFADPVMGMVADRTKSRFGKFRPWLLWGCVPFAIAGVLTFTTPNLSAGGKLIYAYATVSLLMLLYTVMNVPYASLLGVITQQGEERTRLASFRFIGAFTGNIVVQATLLLLVATLGGGNNALGYPLAMGVFGCVAIGLFLYTFFSTRERVEPLARERSSIRKDLGDLARNKPWMVLAAVNIIFQIWVGIRLAAQLYYFKYVAPEAGAPALGLLKSLPGWLVPSGLPQALSTWSGLATAWMVTGTACSLLGVACAPRLMRWLGGKKSAYISLSLANAFFCAIMYFAGPHDFALIFGSQMLGSFAAAPLNALIWAMFADTADYSEWKTGRRSTGLVFSAGSFAQKTGAVMGGAVTGWLLAYYGFQANMTQAPSTLFGIRMMVALLPAAASVLTAIVALFYTLDARTVEKIAADLKAGTVARQNAS